MQHCVLRNDAIQERHLQRDRICITRIGRGVPVLRHSSIIHRDNQPILPTLDPDLVGRVWESDVSEPREE
jgi:hypothetical protein